LNSPLPARLGFSWSAFGVGMSVTQVASVFLLDEVELLLGLLDRQGEFRGAGLAATTL